MNLRLSIACLILFFHLFVLPAPLVQNSTSHSTSAKKESVTMSHAKGTFEVKLAPLATSDTTAGSPLGRMSLDKKFSGDLAGTSKGEMLTGSTSVKGSGVYVAVENVTCTLNGRSGSFLFRHVGVMTRGAPDLSVVVVPDSGTGQLTGITGKMNIVINDGKHSYEFDYSLPEETK